MNRAWTEQYVYDIDDLLMVELYNKSDDYSQSELVNVELVSLSQEFYDLLN